MSRTYRKKYNPAFDENDLELVEYSTHVSKHGVDPKGWIWVSKNDRHLAGLDIIRNMNSIGRDGNKAHGNAKIIINNAVKKINSKVRVKFKHELDRMRSGHIGWDMHYQNHNKIRMVERGYRFYDIF